jgi:exonuclease V gamma subunit
MLAETARHLMEKLMSGWLDGMHRPLPLTCKAGFRALDNQVWEEDGGDWGKVESDFLEEQGQSLTIRRHYSDFGTLLDGGEFRILVESLYTPLHRLVTEYAKENA